MKTNTNMTAAPDRGRLEIQVGFTLADFNVPQGRRVLDKYIAQLEASVAMFRTFGPDTVIMDRFGSRLQLSHLTETLRWIQEGNV